MNIIVIASRNAKKIAELAPILHTIDYEPISVSDWEATQRTIVPEVEENGNTFYANALLKAESLFTDCPFPVLADDSGLIIPTLGGEPGVYSARYSEIALDKNPRNSEISRDEQNINKVLTNLANKEKQGNIPADEKTILGVRAYFATSIIALVKFPDEEGMLQKILIHGEGKCFGSIIKEPKGNNGFGYDPIFIPSEDNPQRLTFAEMDSEKKNQISHRSLALRDFIAKFKKLQEQF